MAREVSFHKIYEEYLNGFNFHTTEIEREKGQKISALVSLLAVSVIVDITTRTLLGRDPEVFKPINVMQNMHDAVYMTFLREHGGVSDDELRLAIDEFKESYKAVAHRINILFNVHLPPINSFTAEEVLNGALETEEKTEPSRIVVAG